MRSVANVMEMLPGTTAGAMVLFPKAAGGEELMREQEQ